MTTALLEVEGLSKNFGGLQVSSDITLDLKAGDRCALIGPNGAGKTTFVNLVTGVLAPTAGTIRLEGQDVTTLSAEARVRRGLIRSFQVARLFRSMTVREHLELAVLERERKTFRLFASVRRMPGLADEVAGLLDAMGLTAAADTPVGTLAYGQQRLLEIALALALKPKVLILDEPAAGVPHSESHRILDALDRLPADLAVLMIEHDMDLVFRFARRIIVLAQGRLLCSGTAQEIAADPRVRDVYLGSRAHVQA
ncbi:ABC transporter ATP-binding protein [Azospirillum rugosum]|uniref:Branched-chain amino acid transport system ATP-binding protein n=1 Tax=Azospirillum rugosum TaxID=416170 RepID=A0ABS4SWL6_9PROT|nr:ABC transporter ATP-binding protein [Azospirillum rugosum]MBP2296468.1 branched-chain amino acid transport system ATP-binding protein [Azospirillum rugosum]MDQ0529989.1 branched-chain amino acid transport system ATP-binding protein [Azospirillum rugosum]